MPAGPPSNISSTIGPPGTLGPSVYMVEPPSHGKRVDFSAFHYMQEALAEEKQSMQKEIRSTQPEGAQETRTPMGTAAVLPLKISSSLNQTNKTTDRSDVTPRNVVPMTSVANPIPPEETVRPDGGGPLFETTTLETQDMDITSPELDIYYGVYPDFQLPLPHRPQISDLFVSNTRLLSDSNSPMSILHIPSLKKMYGTTEFALDRHTGKLYTIRDVDVTPINLFGGIPDEDLNGQTTESTLIPPKNPTSYIHSSS